MKKFEMNAEHRRLVDLAIARGNLVKVQRQREATKRGQALKARRRVEQKATRARPTMHGKYSLPNELRQHLALPGWKVMCARMDPDVWYSFTELRRMMPEYSGGSVKAWVFQKAVVFELFERAGNPDFDPSRPERASLTGRYLYALAHSAAGKAKEWRLALGEGEDTGGNEKSA